MEKSRPILIPKKDCTRVRTCRNVLVPMFGDGQGSYPNNLHDMGSVGYVLVWLHSEAMIWVIVQACTLLSSPIIGPKNSSNFLSWTKYIRPTRFKLSSWLSKTTYFCTQRPVC